MNKKIVNNKLLFVSYEAVGLFLINHIKNNVIIVSCNMVIALLDDN